MNETRQGVFGAALRRRREELGLSLDDLAASTRIRKTYLQALEEENLQALPGTAYSIGFLRIYARQLGLPSEPLLAALSGGEFRVQDHPPVIADQARTRKSLSRKPMGIRLVILLILLLVAGGALLYFRMGVTLDRPPQPVTSRPPAAVLPASPPAAGQPARTETPAETPSSVPEPAFVELFTIPPEGAVVRMIPVSEGTMKVSIDGQEPREYLLQRDQALNWKVSDSLSVELSAPGLVRVSVDQLDLAVADYPAFVVKRAPRTERQP